jgi:hypothetical protein
MHMLLDGKPVTHGHGLKCFVTEHLYRKVLEKYEIGALEESAVTTSYEIEGQEDEFYSELKDAANMYFKTNKVCAPQINCVSLCPLVELVFAKIRMERRPGPAQDHPDDGNADYAPSSLFW